METIPIPSPPIIRKMTSWEKSAHKAHPMAEMEKSNAEIIIVFFRPRKSDSIPATRTPIMEPIRAHPTYQPSPPVERPNCVLTTSVVPDMTAVSYPKRIPPIAATTAKKTIRALTFSIILQVHPIYFQSDKGPWGHGNSPSIYLPSKGEGPLPCG